MLKWGNCYFTVQDDNWDNVDHIPPAAMEGAERKKGKAASKEKY